MSFHEILIAVMAAFAVAGAIDRIFGNRWGLGFLLNMPLLKQLGFPSSATTIIICIVYGC